jgi:flagellar protein FlaG
MFRDVQLTRFEVDSRWSQVIVKLLDQKKKTNWVIRQIPDELALRLAEKLQDEPRRFNIKV